MALTYGSYLQIDELIDLQAPRSNPPQHDEMLFIVIHQVYELWFKQILHELDGTIAYLQNDAISACVKKLRRIHVIQRIIGEQVDVLETMSPQDFNAFRSDINPASGFQSAQFREIEFLCGAEKSDALKHFVPTAAESIRVERRHAGPTLYG